MIKKIFYTLFLSLNFSVFAVNKVFAQGAENLGVNDLANSGLGDNSVVEIVSNLINIFLGFLGIIALILIIYGGWMWMTSLGEAEKIQKAKLILTSAVIGLIIILSSFIIARFVISKISEATGGGNVGPGNGVVLPPPFFVPACPEPDDLNSLAVCKVKPDADSARIGQYISIEGWHFGPYGANSSVKIGSSLASLVSCGGEVSWQEIDARNYPGYYRVKVEVPNMALGDYKINVISDEGYGAEYPDTPLDYFEIVAGQPGPSISCISPSVEKRGERVDIEGRGFGNLPATVLMQAWVDNDQVEISFDSINSWSDTLISGAQIPTEALSSDVTVKVANDISNPEFLQVECSNGVLDCSSGCCALNSCVDASACLQAAGLTEDGPTIDSISPDSAQENNVISIYGSGFGDVPGSVVFQNNDGGEVSGINPSTVNALCVDYWSDELIVIVVPENVKDAVSGSGAQVWVRDAEARESNFKIFYDNGPSLPGICKLDPESAFFDQDVTLYGLNFVIGNKVSFGGIFGNNTNIVSASEAETKVPNVNSGNLSVWLQNNNGQAGNTLPFTVNSLAGGDPVIQELSPNSGPRAQYVTILGSNFGNVPGVVTFSRGGTDVLADVNLAPQCATNYWSPSSIVVKVPALAGPATDYQVTVKRSVDAKISNTKEFSYTLGNPSPGLCMMSPNNGPANDLFAVSLFGENFGNTQAEGDVVSFQSTSGQVNANINTWSNQTVNVRVPNSAISGPVVVKNNNIASNALNFQVNSCGADNDCASGQECCLQTAGNYCAAAGSCPSTSSCSYSWTVTTAAEPFALARNYQCQNNLQSPSPWPDGLDDLSSQDAYVDANIIALFTRNVQDTDFDQTNISVQACNEGGNFEDSACGASLLGDISVINQNSDSEGFVFDPNVNFQANRWYRVTLGQFHSEIGNDVWNGADFSWHFRTQGATCQPSSIQVTPANSPQADLYVQGVKDFYASPQAANCNVCGSDYNWSAWSLPVPADDNKARISFQDTQANISHAQITGLQVTENSVPPTINLQASLNGLFSSAYPKIKGAILSVLDYGPDCNQSCSNAAVWVNFNTALDETTVNTDNILLQKCLDDNCADLVEQNLVTDILLNQAADQVTLLHDGLEEETKYLVSLSVDLKNTVGYKLAPAFEWYFETSDAADCQVDRVVVDPGNYLSTTLGEEINYSAEVYSAPNSCGAAGQLLLADDYKWSWTASPASLVDFPENISPQAPLQTIASGEVTVRASISQAYNNDQNAVGKSDSGDLEINLGSSPVYPVPKILSRYPSTPACFNAAVTVRFDQPMNRSSLESSLKLYKRSAVESADCLLVNGRFWCPVAGSYSFSDTDSGTTAIFYPQADLSANGQYLGVVYPTAKSLYNELLNPDQIDYDYNEDGISDFYAWEFEATDQACQVSFVTVNPNPDLFSCSRNDCAGDMDSSLGGNQHRYTAIAFDASGQALIMDEYQWSEHNSLLNLVSSSGREILATATNQNGTTNLLVEVSDNVAGEATGSTRVNLFMCENPWPRPNPGPFPYNFENSAYNFDTYYCQDFGTAGSPLLPYLSDPITPPVSGTTLEEFIFVVDPQVVATLDHSFKNKALSWWQKLTQKFKHPALAALAIPSAPSSLSLVNNDSNGVRLTWADNSNNEDGFVVERKISDGDWQELTETEANVLSFTDAAVVADQIYNYRVLSFSDGGRSSASNTITVTALASSIDVIGVRVMSNSEHLSVQDWYKKYAPNSTAVGQALEINGYQALKVDNTVYIAAANADFSGGKVYTNIHIFSHNINARLSTQNIFNAMVNNVSLSNNIESNNVCVADSSRACSSVFDCADLTPSTCDADGLKLRRDTQRLGDLMSIKKQLDFYGQLHKACDTNINISCTSDNQCPNGGNCLAYYPLLNSGTYLGGMSVSKWPSWQGEFAQTINLSDIAQDPLNQFTGCPEGFDEETCWNETANAFYCPLGSFVYLYKKEAAVDSYSLDANFEFSSNGLSFDQIQPGIDGRIQLNNDQYCNNFSIIGGDASDPLCGNGLLDNDEECDGGFQNLCDAGLGNANWWNEQLGGCYPPNAVDAEGQSIGCTWYEPSPALTADMCGNACGDGLINSVHELCENTDAAGVIDFNDLQYVCANGGRVSCNTCNPVCTNGALATRVVCGDSLVQGNEQCDNQNLNSQSCQSQGFDFGNLSCYSSCNFDVSACGDSVVVPATCGNGVINRGEDCDGGNLNGQSCQSQGFDFGNLSCNSSCNFDVSSCSGSVISPTTCGNGVINGREDCDGTNLNGQSCTSLNLGQGTLTCNASCIFDISDCVLPSIESPENLSVSLTTQATEAEDDADRVTIDLRGDYSPVFFDGFDHYEGQYSWTDDASWHTSLSTTNNWVEWHWDTAVPVAGVKLRVRACSVTACGDWNESEYQLNNEF